MLDQSGPRLRSLDAFRGLAVAAMIVVNSPGSGMAVYPALVHSAWHGWTFADTIFPAFLWVVGLSMTIATAGKLQRGATQGELLRHAFRRAVMLFCCGLFIDNFPAFDVTAIQLTGVLQKIAACYLIAFAIYLFTNWRGQIAAIVMLNAAYLGIMILVSVPGCTSGPWDVECNVARYANESLLHGHTWHSEELNDPDGLVTVLPATATVLFGILTGQLLRIESARRSVTLILLGSGGILVVAGQALANWIPINKILWTSSYALFMAGVSAVVFGVLYWCIDIRKSCRWLRPMEVLGMNALTAYLLSRIICNVFKIHVRGFSLYADVLERVTTAPNASLLFALTNVVAVYCAAWYMHRRRWFVRL
ncbi:MAG: heparan-alpha-glucosaminide N-acetyltransferase domain-containing protein [Steroidobacteraceae bacterium]